MNKQVVLGFRPDGVAQKEHFRIETVEERSLAAGEVRIRNRYLSVEPAMRGWIADTGNYAPPVGIGEVMRSLAVGKIVESRAEEWRVGDIVSGWFGWQEMAVVTGAQIIRRVVETDQ